MAFQHKLAQNVGSYLRAVETNDASALSASARRVGSDLAWILGHHLEDDEGWPNGAWIDDIVNRQITVSVGHIEIRGLMVWGRGGTTEQWCEPFFARIDVSESDEARYELHFALARFGLGRWRYRERGGIPSSTDDAEWLFNFEGRVHRLAS